MRQYYRVMAPGDPERPDRPEYNVYRAGSKGRGRGRRAEPKQPDQQKGAGDAGRSKPPSEGPGYSVYKARRGFKRTGTDGTSLRDRLSRKGGSGGSKPGAPGEKPTWRASSSGSRSRAAAWLLLSLVVFSISAQIQKSKLDDAAAAELGGFPFLLAQGQNILVIGTDSRPEGTDEAGAETDPKCLEAASHGDPPPSSCLPSRADTLMVVHAGGGSFNKVSIPRDTLASIPGDGDERINAAYAFGGAALQIKTVEDFLGIDINHVVILDFEGFADFIDSIGGVTVNLPAAESTSLINGGCDQRRHHAEARSGARTTSTGDQALALARTRENTRDQVESSTTPTGPAASSSSSQGIKSQLDEPVAAADQLHQGAVDRLERPEGDGQRHGRPRAPPARAVGGDRRRLRDEGPDPVRGERPTATLIIPQKQCRTAVRQLLGEAGPHQPQCSPGGETTATDEAAAIP